MKDTENNYPEWDEINDAEELAAFTEGLNGEILDMEQQIIDLRRIITMCEILRDSIQEKGRYQIPTDLETREDEDNWYFYQTGDNIPS